MRRQIGFTLIEIMVVVVILGMLATLVVTNVIPQQAAAEVNMAKAQAAEIQQAASLFVVRVRRVPTLEELTTRDSNGHAYLVGVARDDPWGTPYEIRELPGHNVFEVRSHGPDREPDTDDDIVAPPES